MDRFARILAVLAGILAAIAGIIALVTAVVQRQTAEDQSIQLAQLIAELAEQRDELDEQGETLEDIRNCRGEIVIGIDEPTSGDQVTSQLHVSGTGTIHQTCRYVFIFVRDISLPAWKVTDLVQVNTNGQWAGLARLDGFVPAGGQANIEARGTAQSDAYVINAILAAPPERGVPSNLVRVRRVQ